MVIRQLALALRVSGGSVGGQQTKGMMGFPANHSAARLFAAIEHRCE